MMCAGYEVLHDVLSNGSAKTNSSQAGGAQALDEFVPGRRVWMKNECENFLGFASAVERLGVQIAQQPRKKYKIF